MWAVRTKSGRCGAITSRTLKVRGTELAAVSVNITAYRWPHWCIKDDLKTSQSMTHTLLFNSLRAYCVTPLLFPEIEFIICDGTVGSYCLVFLTNVGEFSIEPFYSLNMSCWGFRASLFSLHAPDTHVAGTNIPIHILSIQEWNWSCESYCDRWSQQVKKGPKSSRNGTSLPILVFSSTQKDADAWSSIHRQKSMSGKYDNLHPQVPQAGVHLRKLNLRRQKTIKGIRKKGKAYFWPP